MREKIRARQAERQTAREAAGGRGNPNRENLRSELELAIADSQAKLDELKVELGLPVFGPPEEPVVPVEEAPSGETVAEEPGL